MDHPNLPYDFKSARITAVVIGPQRELTLTLTVAAGSGQPLEGVQLRFSGIKNMVEVAKFFAAKPQDKAELNELQYDPAYRSKNGNLHFVLSFAKINAEIKWQCASVAVSRP